MKPTNLISVLAPFAVVLLAGCGSEPAPPPPAATTAPMAAATPTMAAPDEDIFAQAFAAACPDADAVAISSCRSLGMGEADFSCKYGLGDDAVLRNNATLTPVDGEWTLADPETTCNQ